MSLSIGERLKSARETQGSSLDEVAKATRIQRKILEAMEEDRSDEILDPAYAKIFLKKYAAFLGLDSSAFVGEFTGLVGPTPEPPLHIETEATSPFPFLQQVLVPVGMALIALIGLAFLIYLGVKLVDNLSPESPAPAATKAASRNRLAPPSEARPSGPKWVVPLSQPLKLTVRTKADVWMQIKSDGSVIFQNVLLRGTQESWTAKNELEIWTGNAGAMELVLNGKPLGSPGSGVKKGIKVTHAGLQEPG